MIRLVRRADVMLTDLTNHGDVLVSSPLVDSPPRFGPSSNQTFPHLPSACPLRRWRK